MGLRVYVMCCELRVNHCLSVSVTKPQQEPIVGTVKSPAERLRTSRSKPSLTAKVALESSEAVRTRLHALLDDL